MTPGGVWTAYIKQDFSASHLVAAVPVTAGEFSAGRSLRPLIGCRAADGGSGGHTEPAREIGAVDMTPGGV